MHTAQYLKLGYKNIVVISSDHTESASQRDDHYHDVIVAEDSSGSFVRLDAHWYYSIGSCLSGCHPSRKPL
ncbi:MAG: hypothetical protein EPO40_18815 [Myxococcaceae bacterium]|nr:MAG: hypothetical protein EPO40_18815 [Myxococcaceae bacterium]